MKKCVLYVLPITFLLFNACSKKESPKPTATIDAATISIHYNETHQYSVTNATGLTWTSSDTTVGSVNSSGLFTAKKVGSTTIKGTSGVVSVKSIVTVTPYSTMCQEPFFIPGSSMPDIKQKETRVLYGSTNTALLFSGENSKVRNVEYLFDSTGLTSAALLLANRTDVVTEAVTFFKERYVYVGYDGTYSYFTGDNNTVIGLSVNASLGFNAIYIQSETTSKVNSISGMNKLVVSAIQSFKTNIIQ